MAGIFPGAASKETAPAADANDHGFKVVGKRTRKVDGLGLATGKALFVDDWPVDRPLVGRILTSPLAHARIKSIDTSEAEKLPGVACVLTHKDVPRTPHTTAGQGYPEPSPYDTYVLDTKVRFVGDRVAFVAAETAEIAEKALKLIKVVYEELPAILDHETAMDEGQPVIHDEEDASGILDASRNIAAEVGIEVGDVEKGLKAADKVFEGTWRTHYAQHTPIEPHISMAYIDENNRIIIVTATQVPFHVRRIVGMIFDIPLKRIRVIKPRIGGGFGTKQEMLLEDVVVALTLKTGRPVKLEYSRKEEFVSSRTRHPMTVKLRAGVKKDGTITAIDMYALSNTGAYGSHALTVLSNTGSKTLPLYKCENVRFKGHAVYTNMPVGGAYRGYGATQGYFALESLIDDMAEWCGKDPLEFRQMNHIEEGGTSPIFKKLGEGREGMEQNVESSSLPECIEQGAAAIGWAAKRAAGKQGVKKRGVGMCILMQGSGIAGIDMGAAAMKMNEDGSFNLFVGATDIGTGSDTILVQLAAERLGVELEDIQVLSSDTDLTPFDVGAYASSTTYISGGAVVKCADKMRGRILEVAGDMLGEDPQTLDIVDKKVVSPSGKTLALGEVGLHTWFYAEDKKQLVAGASHVSMTSPPPFTAHFAEVEVDTETGKVDVVNYAAATDCGTPLNPNLAEGQVEGCIMNGLSFALTEEYVFSSKGAMLNPNFFDYKIWTTVDQPPLKIILCPTYEPTGPCGAKSVGEIGINGPMPAIANAIYNACGIRLYETPFTPDRVLAALKAKAEEE